MTAETIATGLRRLGTGAGVGIAGGIAGVVLPIALLELAAFRVAGDFALDARLFRVLGLLVVVGALLLLVSLFLYRRAFFALRSENPTFSIAAGLCLIGSIGFLAILVTALLVFGNSDTLAACVAGRPSGALACLRSSSGLGGFTAVLGFWLGWIGGVGLVTGFVASGRRFREGGFFAAAGLFAVLLLVLVGPFLALLYPLPDLSDLLAVVPVLLLLAPAFVFSASRRAEASLSARRTA